ncbi:MAG TPA: SprT family zinc-dependent metalloprotease [Thermoanaerobaculia bacterium]
MVSRLKLNDVEIEIVLKDIRNVHLSVHPPSGRVRLAAPRRMKSEQIRLFAISRLAWIRAQQTKLRAQERETAREYINRESHWVWGKRYLLVLKPATGRAVIELRHRTIALHIEADASQEAREAAVEDWYRKQLKGAVPPLLARWQTRVGVDVERFFVQRMKTKWGSANQNARTIRLNTELAKKPPECLEYLVVHELVHLIEPTHNARFVALMDRHLPQWRFHRDTLNRLPVREERWTY